MLKSGKKLIAAVAVLVLAIALATTATFAWFTMNQSVSVGQIDMDVTTSSGGLYIATTAGGNVFGTTMTAPTTTDIVLDAVTSGTETGADLKKEDGTTAADVKSYLSFVVNFRGTKAFDVKLDTAASSVTQKTGGTLAPVVAWDLFAAGKYQTAEIAKGANLATLAANATRVSFTNDATTVIWNPNSDQGFSSGNLAADYKAHLLGGTAATTTLKGKTSAEMDGLTDGLITLVEDTTNGYFTGSLTVKVYLEGTDGDCLNSILSDKISVKLAFAIKA